MNAQLQSDSQLVDSQFANTEATLFRSYELSLPVPEHHPRAQVIEVTHFCVESVGDKKLPRSVYLVDSALKSRLTQDVADNAIFVEAKEDTLKEISWLDRFIADNPIFSESKTIIGIGGGILLNAAAYIAEKQNIDFISVPTTVLAAADSAIGGLVRINKIDGTKYTKSFYKSVYEPSAIIVDSELLVSLPKNQISWGLSEVVKHGVYQSTPLLEYLASNDFSPFDSVDSLIKSVCWTVALKNVAIIHDPYSESDGGNILRGGHALALTIEESSNFSVSHGQAVAIGVYQDSINNPEITLLLDRIYEKLGLPKAPTDLTFS